jgi:hypothetical protein
MKLKQYQLDFKDFVLNRKRVFNTLDMGMGKTIATLYALQFIPPPYKLTVLITKDNIIEGWKKDAEKLCKDCYNIIHIKGTPKQRKYKLENLVRYLNMSMINIIAIGATRIDDLKHLPLSLKYNTLIIDESSLFKNHNTKRYKELLNFLRVFNPPYRIILNGTPKSDYISLYNQLKILLFPKNPFDMYLTHFRMAFQKQHPYIKGLWQDNLQLNDKLNKLVENLNVIFNVDNNSEYTTEYYFTKIDDIKTSDLERLFKDKIYKDEVITAPKLRYLIYKFSALRRQLKLLQYIKDNNIKKAIIVYPFNEKHRSKFLRHFKELVSDKVSLYDKESIEAFNAGSINYLIVHPANIAYGVNLQFSNAKDIIYLSPYNIGVEQFTQLNKRLARQGNKNKEINIHLTYSLDIEKLNYKKLLDKEFNLKEFLKYFSNLQQLS